MEHHLGNARGKKKEQARSPVDSLGSQGKGTPIRKPAPHYRQADMKHIDTHNSTNIRLHSIFSFKLI